MPAELARPRLRKSLVSQAIEEAGVKYVDVSDPFSRVDFRFYDFEFEVAKALDGRMVSDVAAELAQAQDSALGVAELTAFVNHLASLGFLEGTVPSAPVVEGDDGADDDAGVGDEGPTPGPDVMATPATPSRLDDSRWGEPWKAKPRRAMLAQKRSPPVPSGWCLNACHHKHRQKRLVMSEAHLTWTPGAVDRLFRRCYWRVRGRNETQTPSRPVSRSPLLTNMPMAPRKPGSRLDPTGAGCLRMYLTKAALTGCRLRLVPLRRPLSWRFQRCPLRMFAQERWARCPCRPRRPRFQSLFDTPSLGLRSWMTTPLSWG